MWWNASALTHFDVNKRSTVSADAIQYGLGIVLVQDEHLIDIVSTSLTETQQRYSQIEK